MKTLSGGNQQKVVLGRWLVDGTGRVASTPERPLRSSGTRLLLLDEPTRGVDIGARADLYRVIRRLADEGMGVLMVSSEVPEVLAWPTACSSCGKAASSVRRRPAIWMKQPSLISSCRDPYWKWRAREHTREVAHRPADRGVAQRTR